MRASVAVVAASCAALFAPILCARQRVAIIDLKKAIMETAEGQGARQSLEGRFREPLDSLNRVPPDQRENVAYRRQKEDLQHDLDNARTRVLNDLGKKMNLIVEQYARRKHYEVVVDVSDSNSSVVWFKKKNDITAQIIAAYDRAHPIRAAAP